MRILVAGASGFIGSHLCDTLLEANHEVVGLDNFVTGRRENTEHLLGHPGFSLIEWDITRPWTPDGPFDRIYHLASPASPVGYMRNPILTHITNSTGTHNLLDLARELDARFLFASTSEAYGDPLIHPQPETYFGNVNPVGPRSCYDESKRYGESITMEFIRQYGLDGRIVRIFNTYGPRSDPNDGRVIPAFIMNALSGKPLRIYGDGEQTRSLCYVSDLVRGLVLAMESTDTWGEVINLGNPDERTVLTIAEAIIAACESTSEVKFLEARPDDPYLRCPDITKARRLLGWEPNVGIEDGLRETIRDLNAHVPSDHVANPRR